jgi:hypothetical protein
MFSRTRLSLSVVTALALLGACFNTNRGDRCTVGNTRECYEGPEGTKGIGPCGAGFETCLQNGTWSGCVGQVLPIPEACSPNTIDEDCNAIVDDVKDSDGDGFTTCTGDCCEFTGPFGCPTPSEVNSSAIEIAGNLVDDNCSGTVDEAVATCDSGLVSGSTTATDFAKAIDLCSSGTVKTATFTLADGTSTPAVGQKSIRTAFGTNIAPRNGESFIVLSTGVAAALGQTNPAYSAFDPGTTNSKTSAFPADWYAANGNAVPTTASCPAPGGTQAQDPVMLTLSLRVPSNARAFELDFFFLSADYPEWVCTTANDVFVVLLDSTYAGEDPNPSDKNIASNGSASPITVQLAVGDTGLFTACRNGGIGCSGSSTSTISTCAETTSLAGTGFDTVTNQCETGGLLGGGTGWLKARGNVVPNETITVRFAVWDSLDQSIDSLVLIDNFRWLNATVTPGASL